MKLTCFYYDLEVPSPMTDFLELGYSMSEHTT